jgi:hypothetical protein
VPSPSTETGAERRELVERLRRAVGVVREPAAQHGHAVLREQLLRLVLVDFTGPLEWTRAARRGRRTVRGRDHAPRRAGVS